MDWYILDENDKPILSDILTASKFLQESDRRVVSYTEINSTCFLSTVFLCLDHCYGRGAPILYESLWFGGSNDGDMRRYRTKEEALLGHREMLEEYKKENPGDLEFGDWDIVKL